MLVATRGGEHNVKKVIPVIVAIIIGVIVFATEDHSGKTLNALTMQSGVHICLSQHYNKTTLYCTQDDSTITTAQISHAHLSYTGESGSNFTSTDISIIINSPPADGSGGWIEVGRWQQTAQLNYDVMSGQLSHVMIQANAPIIPGQYQITVENGSSSLGTATITIR